MDSSDPDKTTTYTYDDAGNRATEQERDPFGALITNKTLIYNARSQLENMADLLDPARNLSYGYDANGNRTSRTQGSELTELTYDTLDRITRIVRWRQGLRRRGPVPG